MVNRRGVTLEEIEVSARVPAGTGDTGEASVDALVLLPNLIGGLEDFDR